MHVAGGPGLSTLCQPHAVSPPVREPLFHAGRESIDLTHSLAHRGRGDGEILGCCWIWAGWRMYLGEEKSRLRSPPSRTLGSSVCGLWHAKRRFRQANGGWGVRISVRGLVSGTRCCAMEAWVCGERESKRREGDIGKDWVGIGGGVSPIHNRIVEVHSGDGSSSTSQKSTSVC